MKKETRKTIYNKYDGYCAYCGEQITYKNMQVDHIYPKDRAHIYFKETGKHVDDISNLNPSCRICNNYKYNWDIELFRKNLSKQVERARKTSMNFRMAERYGLIKITNKPVEFYFESVEKKE